MPENTEVFISAERSDREYVETIASLRHYSNLRFAVLSVFYATSAGLVVAAFGLNVGDSVKFAINTSIIFKVMGLLVATILLIYDFMIDEYQIAFRKHLQTFWSESHWFKRPKFGAIFQWPLWLLYGSVILMWIVAIVTDPSLWELIHRI